MYDDGSPSPLDELSGSGTLIIRASTARGAIPVPDVLITVTPAGDKNNSGIIKSVLTGESGLTSPISLPAPSSDYSLTPNPQKKPFAEYNIDAYLEGYYTQRYQSIPIFDGITSVQGVELIPIPSSGKDPAVVYDEDNISESTAPDL